MRRSSTIARKSVALTANGLPLASTADKPKRTGARARLSLLLVTEAGRRGISSPGSRRVERKGRFFDSDASVLHHWTCRIAGATWINFTRSLEHRKAFAGCGKKRHTQQVARILLKQRC